MQEGTPVLGEHALIAISGAVNLLLVIPAILVTIPSAPLPRAIRRTSPSLSKIAIYTATITLSVLPSNSIAVLGDVLLVLSLSGTYVLPGRFYVLSATQHI